jgi:hypothetical protein
VATSKFDDLLVGLKNEDPEVRRWSAAQLGSYERRAAIPALIAALTDEQICVRLCVIDALGRVGSRLRKIDPRLVAQAVQPLLRLLAEDPKLPSVAAEALGSIRLNSQAVVPALIAAMEDQDAHVHTYSAEALGRFGWRAMPAVDRLLKGLSDPAQNVRFTSAVALGKIGCKRTDIRTALQQAFLHDEDEDVREAAAFAFEKLEWS